MLLVYFLATAAEDGEYVFCGSVTMDGDISDNIELKEAYDMGISV